MATIFWPFTLSILATPLFFGMVGELIQALFACLIFSLTAGLCIYQIWKNKAPFVPIRWVGWQTAAFLLVMTWALFQTFTMPVASMQHPLWAEAGRVLEKNLAGAISLSPGDGIQAWIRMATYGVIFWLALQLGRNRRQARMLIDCIVLAGTIYALYGMVVELSGIPKVLWWEKKAMSMGSVSGPFINRNSFATYTGLSLICAVGTYLSGFLGSARQGRRGRDRLVALWHAALVQGAPRLASILILLAALFLSGSRGGVISTLIALSIFLALYGTIYSARRRFSGIMVVALLATVFFTAAMSGDHFFRRISSTDLANENRFRIYYSQTLEAIDSAPLTGFGLGSFKQTFPLYADFQTSQLDRAHNDWLEMIFELGWPAAMLWFVLLTSLALKCLVGFFRRNRDHFYPLAGFSAALLVGLHACVDFSLQLPAVASTFAALLAIGIAQSYNSRE